MSEAQPDRSAARPREAHKYYAKYDHPNAGNNSMFNKQDSSSSIIRAERMSTFKSIFAGIINFVSSSMQVDTEFMKMLIFLSKNCEYSIGHKHMRYTMRLAICFQFKYRLFYCDECSATNQS